MVALLLSSDAERCSLEVSLSTFRGDPSCYFDTKVREAGTMIAPCDDGPAEAQFRGQTFHGTVKRGRVSLSSRTEFDWQDGCRWESVQTITGELREGELQFKYTERPIRGAECFHPCPASGTLDIDCADGECACVQRCRRKDVSAPVSSL